MGSLCLTMPWSAPPPPPSCPTCKKSVYAQEAYMAADRTPFHIACLKCWTCQKKLTPATINEHQHRLYCPACYENLFCLKDDIPERMVMQVLPIQGLFLREPQKEEFLSPEELRKREEAEAAAQAWREATEKSDCLASSIKVRESMEIAPVESITL